MEPMTDTQVWLLLASLVATTSGIVFIATWTYKDDQVRALLKERIMEREARDVELTNARIINQTFGAMRGVDVANMEERRDGETPS